MKIDVLFDKSSKDKNLRTGWGVSFLIDDRFIFDTGERGDWLLENMDHLKIGLDGIEGIIISHDHWDHWGGLWDILKKKKGLKVYACPRFGEEFKERVRGLRAELIEAGGLREISKDIFTTGEIAGSYNGRYMAEQALVAKTGNGISVVTGCAHPGVVRMIQAAVRGFPGERVYAALGGFHLMRDDMRAVEMVAEEFRKMGVKKAGPTHCSGDAAEDIFRQRYGSDFISVKVGGTIDV